MKKTISLFLIIFSIFIILFINTLYAVNNNKVNDENLEKLNQSIIELLQNNNQKVIEETTIYDVIQGEQISPELRQRILELLDKYQLSLDSYRTIIENENRKSKSQIFDLKKDLNKIYEFHDELEYNFDMAKWMIISLSVGIICLTTIIVIMWKSVVNVNRNDVEVIFTLEKFKKDLNFIKARLEMIENKSKDYGKEQIQDNKNRKEV